MGNFITDHELQGPPNFLMSSLMNTNLMPPPSSPVQTRRDSILKHQGSVKTDKRVSIKQTPTTTASNNNGKLSSSNIEYVSEKANDGTMIASNSRKRQGKPPSGKWNILNLPWNYCKNNTNFVFRTSSGIIGNNKK